MRVIRQKTILIIVLTLLLSAAGAFADPQEQLSPENKKALRKFDPADIVPEVRGGVPGESARQGDSGRKKSKQNDGTATLTRNAASPAQASAPEIRRGEASGKSPTPTPGKSPAPTPGKSPTPSPGPTGNATSATPKMAASGSAMPKPTPTQIAQSTPSPQATTLVASKATPVPTQSALAMTQPSEPTGQGPLTSAPTLQPSVRASGFSLPVIFSLLGLILFALVVVVTRLKRDLRMP